MFVTSRDRTAFASLDLQGICSLVYNDKLQQASAELFRGLRLRRSQCIKLKHTFLNAEAGHFLKEKTAGALHHATTQVNLWMVTGSHQQLIQAYQR